MQGLGEPKEIVVLSGKGGTGKTTLVGALAALASNKVLADCDVDAADLHLLLHPDVKQSHEFWSGQEAIIDREQCTECGLCQEQCRYNAIQDFQVDPLSCEGCGFCSRICPTEAIRMQEKRAGYWYLSDTRYGPLVHAKLGLGEENSGKLVTAVRRNARATAKEHGMDYILSDGPPGIGCPVISSLSGASLALLVTEPTLSGMHDLERVVSVCRHFGVLPQVCINKCDLNDENSRQIEAYCSREAIQVVGRIPFDNVVTEALVQGMSVVEFSKGRVVREIEDIWDRIASTTSRSE